MFSLYFFIQRDMRVTPLGFGLLLTSIVLSVLFKSLAPLLSADDIPISIDIYNILIILLLYYYIIIPFTK